jgi:hypothetical protein
MMNPTRSREMPSCSAIDLAEIRRSSKISSWIWSIISGVVGQRTYQHSGIQNRAVQGDAARPWMRRQYDRSKRWYRCQ